MKVDGNFQPLDLILPVGVSFYTFQTMGYLIDVYRQKTDAERNPQRAISMTAARLYRTAHAAV